MDADLRERLKLLSLRLHKRALELSHRSGDGDIATLMSAMAVIVETLGVLGEEVRIPRSGPSPE
ncbi:hypothetical protein [Mesorhizobium sp.]|uniref:hypothetical protein n=1 Tax=Mesorhizobium sp. TaxID=1871066 RepID=UPI001211C350|nr:hypothetical protein [Mesorhizobium sp.]TIS63877.1 MAG: hypothetical protein E5W92_25865 [Mesorhizobium sp.]